MMAEAEETTRFQPKYDSNGLIPAIVTDANDGSLLMFAFMNAEALRQTLESGFVHFWSRSRGRLWRKGESSGETLAVVEILTDCDQDVLQIKAQRQGRGAACHTGRKSCFYRRLADGGLEIIDHKRLFDPANVYR
jgi:phosphoribosyl-AMP cyclohydrolase